MSLLRIFVLAVLSGSLVARAHAVAPQVGIAELGWLSGEWRGQLNNGAMFWARYSDAEGGVILSVSKEMRDGKVVFFEFEHFGEKDGTLVYSPHPNGAKRPSFTLTEFDRVAKRAVFENPAHDFPKKFTFASAGGDRLVITLSGPGKDGAIKETVFALQRVRVDSGPKSSER